MSINASMIVEVTPRVVRAGSSDLQFNGMVFTKSPLASICDIFTSANQVGEQFGYESPEYQFAQVYWEADEQKTRSPEALYFSRLTTEATAAWIRGFGMTATLADLKKITDGVLTVPINGSDVQATGIDLSEATSLSDVATTIAGKLTGTTGQYNSGLNAFIFTTTETGSTATIDYAKTATGGTDLGPILGLTQDDGAALWQGTDAQSFAECVSNVLGVSQNWVTFTTIDTPETALAQEIAQWVSANFGFIYYPNTTDNNAASAQSQADLASVLDAAGVSNTAPVYGTPNYCAFFMGMQAATDYSATNGVKTYAFKRSALLPANVTNSNVAEVLANKRYNFLGNFAMRNAEFDVSSFGTLLGDSYRFIDELGGMIWLTNSLQRTIMDGLTSVNRVPYTERGYTMIRTWCMAPINQGLQNGYIEPGVTLSATQKTQLIEAIGQDVSQEIYNNGWYLRVADPGAEARANRQSPICDLYFTYGGAVHRLELGASAYF